MRGGAEQHHGGDQREQGEGHQAEPVQHDGRVLPVVDHQHGLLTGPDGVCDNPGHSSQEFPPPQRGLTDQHLLDLLEYEGELPGVVRGGGGGGDHAGHGMMSTTGVVTRGQGDWPVREGPTNNS